MIRWIIVISVVLGGGALQGAEPFQAPFMSGQAVDTTTSLNFDMVLRLVAERNPILRELASIELAAEADIRQAGIRPLPELDIGVEEVCWDAPGFSNAEIGLSVSQELELFGRRRARIDLAEASGRSVRLETAVAAFDLYLDARQSYLNLVHAQECVRLRKTSLALSQKTLDNIVFRIEKGAALQVELLLARLDLQWSLLNLAEAEQRSIMAQISLASLWGASGDDLAVEVGDWDALDDIAHQIEKTGLGGDSSRELLTLDRQQSVVEAEQRLARAEGRPSLTLTAGLKRLQADQSNSLMFGVALPLPLWHSNEGAVKSSEARLAALQHRAERQRLSADAEIRSAKGHLRELIERLEMMDAQLLNTAEEAYATLSEAHRIGKVPYTSLLEAERSLVELRLERNDVVLAIHETVISLERLSGLNLESLGKKE